ncbi:MAG: sugar phosphate isomerase/epimerase [Lachnospiraceae bacterium]|nr:sugar phosphate isomerase/epimerase [Lachnospiraceae bacterium]
MKNKILCSTGAFTGRSNGYNYRLLEPLSKILTCDGFELMVDDEWHEEIEEVKCYIKNLNLYIPVVHCSKDIGELISKGSKAELATAYKMFETDCGVAAHVGAHKLVLHLWGGRASDSNFQSNVRAYQHVNEVAKSFGLDLLIENVVCNVENPMKHLCELREIYPDIQFVFDTKMAAFHEQLDLLYESEYDWLWKEGHIRHYHVNDYGGGYMDWANLRTLPIGKGHVDFEKFFGFVKKTGYQGDFTVEATALDNTGAVDVEMLNEQFQRIRDFMREDA